MRATSDSRGCALGVRLDEAISGWRVGSEARLRASGAQDEIAAAVRADVAKALIGAACAEGALVGADPSVWRPVREIAVAALTVGS